MKHRNVKHWMPTLTLETGCLCLCWHFYCRLKLNLLTCDRDPAVWRLSITDGVTLVESFIRPGNMVDGHVTCRLSPDEGAIFIESSWEVGGLCCTGESEIISLHHREDRTLQDHCSTSTHRQTTAFHPPTQLHQHRLHSLILPVTVMLMLLLAAPPVDSHQ